MSNKEGLAAFWFRRDLRVKDNIGLSKALESGRKVICVFIFDENILSHLPKNDARVTFIFEELMKIKSYLQEHNSDLQIGYGEPSKVWSDWITDLNIKEIFTNKDYEPYARKRDFAVSEIIEAKGGEFHRVKDQVVFEENEVLKDNGTPYTVFTPFKKKWLARYAVEGLPDLAQLNHDALHQFQSHEFNLEKIGFTESQIKVKPFDINNLENYKDTRDFPDQDATSYLSPHLRFGTISTRDVIRQTNGDDTFISELIWREFFMQIMYHFPKVIDRSFKEKYDVIPWRNNESEFEKWKKGETGYPIVDAGMRQLNETGYMHNRVRMVVASFLVKHLLIDWRWGEAYFAEKLLDFDLSANNGNWQWAAGTGCDAAPYFRVFNPTSQQEKFDPKMKYIRKWVKDIDELTYPRPMVEHKMARQRAIDTYKEALS